MFSRIVEPFYIYSLCQEVEIPHHMADINSMRWSSSSRALFDALFSAGKRYFTNSLLSLSQFVKL